jgi:hypothetical protein
LFPDPEADADASASEIHSVIEATGPKCAACEDPVTQPCWFCVQCEGLHLSDLCGRRLTRASEPSFICFSCESDSKKKIAFGYHQAHSHDLVRVQQFVEEVEVTLEDRLADLEQRFIQHEANMDQRLNSLEAKVEDRLLRVDDRLLLVEKLLERVLLALEQPR